MGHSVYGSACPGGLPLLVACLFLTCAFELVNGFHDSANAVATVIYTKTLRPKAAVVWSGLCTFAGVYFGGIAVAMSVIKLLPVALVMHSGQGAGIAMLLALLLSAIVWNLATWGLGLPASSTHTLMGAIAGVGLANSLRPGHAFGDGMNWRMMLDVLLSLIISPLLGLTFAALLTTLARKLLRRAELHRPPSDGEPPPWIRALLVGTCTGVSFAHGSNDGQKGVGLIMLILMGLLPADFALDRSLTASQLGQTITAVEHLEGVVRDAEARAAPLASKEALAVPGAPQTDIHSDLAALRATLATRASVAEIPRGDRWAIRRQIIHVDAALARLEATGALNGAEAAATRRDRRELRLLVDYAPGWVLALVASSLGMGTMLGWRRIARTIYGGIGKAPLTYAQGASAEIVTAATIGASAHFGLPLSTTHVLSSGIAGTTLAGKSGVQLDTIRNVALAWVLTFPLAMLLAGGFFLVFLRLIQ